MARVFVEFEKKKKIVEFYKKRKKSQFSDLRMTTVKLKPDELAAFKEAFDMFDRKGDGSISTKVGPAKISG